MQFRDRRDRRQQGVSMVIVVLALAGLIGFIVLSVDNGYMLASKTQLQNATDAAALAASVELRRGNPYSEARAAAIAVAGANHAGGDAVTLDAADIEFGGFDFDSRSFEAGGFGGVTAVKVTAQKDLDLLLAPIVGADSAQLTTSAVAALGRRDVVLVQDVTYSFIQEIEDARDALETFSNAMAAQSLAGDRVGLVTFNEASDIEQLLTEIPDQLPAILSAIADFDYCTNTSGNCRGTHIAPGLQDALQIFEQQQRVYAEKVIILISDGVPCGRWPGQTAARRQAALDAAADAAEAGVSTFSIFLDKPGEGNYCGDVYSADEDFMEQLVTGFGGFYSTPNEEDLDEILVSIVGQMPMKLVE